MTTTTTHEWTDSDGQRAVLRSGRLSVYGSRA
jgi:hypothetical protein